MGLMSRASNVVLREPKKKGASVFIDFRLSSSVAVCYTSSEDSLPILSLQIMSWIKNSLSK